MNDTHHRWSESLSDYLDGGLSAADAAGVEAHLGECADCRRVLDDLRGLVAAARGLEPRSPARDLWPGIRERIEAEKGARILELPTGPRRGGRTPWSSFHVRLSIPQLAAASVALLLMGGGAVGLLGPAGAPDGAGVEKGTPSAAVRTASLTPEEEASGEEIRELEEALARGRDRLTPNTIRILEKNLGIIDRAIRESRAALEVDPGNPFLQEYLDSAVERKREYLRQTVALVEAST